MPTIVVKEQLKKLVELQRIDGEVYQLKVSLEEKPAFIEKLKGEFESQKAKLKLLEEKAKNLQLDRKNKELELKTKEDEIIKANGQLSQLKTNKEYSAKLSEIENIKADKSIIEERILLSFDEADSVGKEIEKEKAVVAEIEKGFLAQKKLVDDEVKQIQDRVKVLETERQQILPGVDPSILVRYEKILNHKNGIAIAPIHGNTCGGCFMNIPTQAINQIRLYSEFVGCEMCTRILYVEEDL